MNLRELISEDDESLDNYLDRCALNGARFPLPAEIWVFKTKEALHNPGSKIDKVISISEHMARIRELEYLEPEQDEGPVPVRLPEPEPARSELIKVEQEGKVEWLDSMTGVVKHRFG